eukprot:TRINITY_DN49389_c0_g1_i1.p1 TRINITY_DN49389_c0_g1~~TRINITY_DN49389_c0_g1_i1.p1  ORF type:complete len:619 (-),score=101.92 TRINITY_DN49389_c0_g1_i1:19-1875(-)
MAAKAKPDQGTRKLASDGPPKPDSSWRDITGATWRLVSQTPKEVVQTDWSEERRALYWLFQKPVTESCLSIIIVVSILLLCFDVDAHAWRGDPQKPEFPESPLVLSVVSKVFVLFFVAEVCLRLFALRSHFVAQGWLLDLFVVTIDFVLAVVDLAYSGVPTMSYLRIFRIVRLLRVRRVIQQFPELCYLISGIASSMRSILWGTIMVYIMIVVWSIVAVVLIHPVALRVAQGDPECDHCLTAWSSVWHAILTLSQTLVFTDEWGNTALPIIREEPISFVFFLIAYSSVALAALNLILAAIVDSGAQAREEAFVARSESQRQAKALEEEERTRYLLTLCQQLDYDDSGSLTLEELLQGFEKNPNFGATMAELQLERADIEIFFTVIDKDNSGEVDYKEFLDLVAQARAQASQQVLTFVKFAILDMRAKTQNAHGRIQKQIDELSRHVHEFQSQSKSKEEGKDTTTPPTEQPGLPKARPKKRPSRSPDSRRPSKELQNGHGGSELESLNVLPNGRHDGLNPEDAVVIDMEREELPERVPRSPPIERKVEDMAQPRSQLYSKMDCAGDVSKLAEQFALGITKMILEGDEFRSLLQDLCQTVRINEKPDPRRRSGHGRPASL